MLTWKVVVVMSRAKSGVRVGEMDFWVTEYYAEELSAHTCVRCLPIDIPCL